MTDRSNGPSAGHRIVGRYRLDEPVASGGMARVWKGTDLVLGRTVAVKVLHPHLAEDPAFVERFRREAQAAARLNDSHIVAIFDSVTEDDVSALILQYIDGVTLRDRLVEGVLSSTAAVGIGAQVAMALEVAHAAGIVHRDIKPGNVLLCAADTTGEATSPVPRVRVTDFGIAKALAEEEGAGLTSANSVVGTAKYLAPEQVTGGPLDGRTDLFALGVVLYEAVTGHAPWRGDTDLATALARVTAAPTPPRELQPALGPELEAIILQALALDPNDRFQSATEFREALEHCDTEGDRSSPAREHDESATTSELTEDTRPLALPARRAPRRWRRLTWMAPLLVATIGAAALAAWVSPARTGDSPGTADTATTALEGALGGTRLSAVVASTYDFYGDDDENDDLVRFVTDGVTIPSPETGVWRSQCYADADPLPKPGFGLVLQSPELVRFSGVEIVSLHPGWTADIHVSSGTASTLRQQPIEAWGAVLTTLHADASTDRATLPPTTGRSLLIFFRSLRDVAPQECFGAARLPYRVDVVEVSAHGES